MNFLFTIAASLALVLLTIFVFFIFVGWACMKFAEMVDETNDAIDRNNQICEEVQDEI